MIAKHRKYNPDRDFLRVRDLLVNTYPTFEKPANWCIERWNYARYLVVPYLGPGRTTNRTPEDSLKSIRLWEDAIHIWENDKDDIVGAVTVEYPWRGEVFLQRHPGYDALLDEMLCYAEGTLADKKTNTLGVYIYDYDKPLQTLAQQRGYRQNTQHPEYDSEFVIGDLLEEKLPEGYVIRSMADENDLELRRKIYGLGFNHRDPSAWASVFAYQELQRAPDYRKDLDLVVVGPEGEYVSCCIVWYDERNRLGIFEHVATHLDFRRRGFGRAVVMEGVRRIAALGATKARVGSGQEFYEAIGFQKKYVSYKWTKQCQATREDER